MTTYLDTLPNELVELIYTQKNKLEYNTVIQQIKQIRISEERSSLYGMIERWTIFNAPSLLNTIKFLQSTSKNTYTLEYYTENGIEDMNITKKQLLEFLFKQNNKQFVKSKTIKQLTKEFLSF